MEEIKRIPSCIYVYDYIVEFKYKTPRNNDKTQKRIITCTNDETAEEVFKQWLREQTIMKGFKAMLNVEILSIAEVENTRRKIEL